MTFNLLKTTALLFTLVVISCGKEGPAGPPGPAGNISLLDIVNEPAGANCATGGIKIKSGIDRNNNNILDSAEVDNTRFVCNGADGGYDKQLMLPLSGGGAQYITPTTFPSIYKFNKRNFVNVDSITFYARLYAYPLPNTAIYELYNFTDSVVIANSRLTSSVSDEQSVYQQTGNLYNSLPDKEITLGVSMSSSTNYKFAANAPGMYIILYRK